MGEAAIWAWRGLWALETVEGLIYTGAAIGFAVLSWWLWRRYGRG